MISKGGASSPTSGPVFVTEIFHLTRETSTKYLRCMIDEWRSSETGPTNSTKYLRCMTDKSEGAVRQAQQTRMKSCFSLQILQGLYRQILKKLRKTKSALPAAQQPVSVKATRSSLKKFSHSNALRACVYIYIQQLSSFRMPTLRFIDLIVATYRIQ